MKRSIAFLAAVATAMVILPAPTAAQSDGSAFFESALLTDTPDDFPGNGGLDVVAVHVFETYSFDFERRQENLGNTVSVRIEVADLSELATPTTPRFHVFATLNDTMQNLWVDLVFEGGTGGCQCWRPGETAAGVSGAINGTSVTMTIPYSLFGLAEGQSIDGVWVATSLGGGEERFYQDVAPMDNGGLPAGPGTPATPGGATAITLQGPFPFVELVPKGPLERFSAEGAEVKYPFEVRPHPQLSGEIVIMLFEVPEGWVLEPSRGSGGATPSGQIANLNGGTTLGFDVTVSSDFFPPIGSEANVTMEVVSSSGAHDLFEMVTTVTGPKLNSSEYKFDMLSPPSASAGDTTQLEFSVLTANGSALPSGLAVKVDMMQAGEIVETVPAKGDGNGTFVAEYAFPSEGQWTADVYISNLRPSPHQAFDVNVSGGGLVPGPGVAALFAAAAVAFLAYRRRD